MLWLARSYAQLDLVNGSFTANSLFHLSAWPFYSFLYTTPVVLIALPLVRFPRAAFAAALLMSLLSLLLVTADSTIYNLYGFHINGFVLNLIFTPGGISSLGVGGQTWLSFAGIIFRLFMLQGFFLAVSLALGNRWAGPVPRIRHSLVAALVLFLVQGTVYGISDIRNQGEVLDSSNAYPLFRRVRFRTLAGHLGITPQKRHSMVAEVDTSRLNYPLEEVRFAPVERPPNIIMLVAESLRWDQLTEEVMPNTWAFGQRGLRFTRHYSSGNGTREALFGMFYGLYGAYWENFLHAQRSPLLMDRIQALGYKTDIRTSARFTYPEFDKTLFARVPVNQLHEADEAIAPWQRDERNTTAVVDFLGQQTGETPFFTFFFLESTHASYSFPDTAAVRTPYLDALDYAEMSRETLAAEQEKLRNRYSNAAHWVDVQLGRIYTSLEAMGLLENTIVIVTGDHGEEFMEHGAWGHNSSFVEEQTHVPMVVWMPGKGAETIRRPTSHMDIATTLLQHLGAERNSGHYSLGQNLLDDSQRDFITLSDWHSIAVMTRDLKYRIPYLNTGVDHWSPTGPDDKPLADEDAIMVMARNSPLVIRAMENCTAFSRRGGQLMAANP